jgi:hypothetical protein
MQDIEPSLLPDDRQKTKAAWQPSGSLGHFHNGGIKLKICRTKYRPNFFFSTAAFG